MANLKALCIDGLDHLLEKLRTIFVEKEAGKGLSTNDFTTIEKNKLSTLTETKIDEIKVNGSVVAPTAKSVNIDLSNYALKNEISNVYKYVSSVQTYAELPTTGNKTGDVYNIEQADEAHDILAGDNVAWNGTAWDRLGGKFEVDLSNYVEKEAGKGLSTNDFTNEEKQKLATLEKVEAITNAEIDALFV